MKYLLWALVFKYHKHVNDESGPHSPGSATKPNSGGKRRCLLSIAGSNAENSGGNLFECF